MRIALPYEEGRVCGHFGHCGSFEIYTVEEGNITGRMLLPANGSGHKYMSSLMQKMKVDVVLAGNMGGPALSLLNAGGIRVYLGLEGLTEPLVKEYLSGGLESHYSENCDPSMLDHHCGCHE